MHDTENGSLKSLEKSLEKLNFEKYRGEDPSFNRRKRVVFQPFFWISIIGILFLGLVVFYFKYELRMIRISQRGMHKTISKLKYELTSDSTSLYKDPSLLHYTLKHISLADDNGIVLGSKTISIRNALAPYNGSIIENDSGGYLCFFRYDTMHYDDSIREPYYSHIGMVELDSQFNQTDKEYVTINTKSDYSEDARVVRVGEEMYLVYNDLQSYGRSRAMHIANLNKKDFSVRFLTNLNIDLGWIEKNWVPFEYVGKDNNPRMMFEYHLSPHKILELPNPRINDLRNLAFPNVAPPNLLPWNEREWGRMCGGTPAKKIGDEYLAFFHSHFTDPQGNTWYLMGAYTFEASPPFRITMISKTPILFKGLYNSRYDNTAELNKRVIFPAGFVIEKQNKRELIHVSCGENDAAIKIVTIDKDELFKSMRRVKFKTVNKD